MPDRHMGVLTEVQVLHTHAHTHRLTLYSLTYDTVVLTVSNKTGCFNANFHILFINSFIHLTMIGQSFR